MLKEGNDLILFASIIRILLGYSILQWSFGCLFTLYSKEEIYSSKVKYFVKKGTPYIWIPEHDLHNVVWYYN